MAFEGVKRFGQRVSKLSRCHNALGDKKRSRKKGEVSESNKNVMGLIEQAGSDYAKGETDLAIYRLTRVLSSMERECSSLEETQAATHIVSPPVKFDGAGKNHAFIAPRPDPTTKRSSRKLLHQDEIAYCNALQCSPPLCIGVPTIHEPAQSHGTVIEDYEINIPKAIAPNSAAHDDKSIFTLRDVKTEVSEFSGLIERSFNLLTIGDSVAALDDDTTRFEDRVLFLNSPGTETVWSKSIANECQTHTLETATNR
ncbi:LAFA_0G06766g1_1 [Lachancea sp. 'fantastica']|nr:LAFA_0G06766g1_1 [Lachancea sp. 'fantastica']